jgi:hypothetical protein
MLGTNHQNPQSGFFEVKVPAGVQPFQQLYVNGQRMQRARMPNVGASERGLGDDSTLKYKSPIKNCTGSVWSSTCPPEDKWGFVFKAGDFSSKWRNIKDIQVLVFHSWTAFWSDVESVYEDNSTVIFQSAALKAVGEMALQGGQRYLIENVFEGLDEGTVRTHYTPTTHSLYTHYTLTKMVNGTSTKGEWAPSAASVQTVL